MTQATSLASGPRLDADDAGVQSHERKRFRMAMSLSALSHALVIVLLYLLWQPVGEENVPPAPIPITIVQAPEGQSGAAGGGEGETAASSESQASEQAAEAQPEASAEEPEPQQPTPPVEAQPQPAPEVPSLAQTTAIPAPAAQETTEPVPLHKPRPPRPKPPPTPTETAQATPTPPTPQPAQQPAAAATTPAQTASAAGSNQPLPPGVGGRGRGDQGPGLAAVGNGAHNGPGDDYLDAVRRWVTRYKKYPEDAVKQKQEGVVQLGFKFTRDGMVTDAWIEKSSGFPALDQAALAMIHAASPIPKVPDRYQGDTLTLVMPENFKIGLFDRLFH
jgi:protein TonB